VHAVVTLALHSGEPQSVAASARREAAADASALEQALRVTEHGDHLSDRYHSFLALSGPLGLEQQLQ
jgi:hypothetical protein